jgi:hypothetical protein
MGRPMRPSPIKPIFMGPIFFEATAESKRGLLEGGGREARQNFAQVAEKIVAELGGGGGGEKLCWRIKQSWGGAEQEEDPNRLRLRRWPRRYEALRRTWRRRKIQLRMSASRKWSPWLRWRRSRIFLRCARDIDMEFPSESACAGRVVRNSARGRWSGRNRRQRYRKRAEGYRQRDIAPPHCARERRNSEPSCT